MAEEAGETSSKTIETTFRMKTNMEKITEQKISAWKKKYGSVYEISVEGRKGYFRSPDRNILGYALSQNSKNPIVYNEVLAKNCWIDGDRMLLEDDTLFLSISGKLADLIEIKEAALKKL